MMKRFTRSATLVLAALAAASVFVALACSAQEVTTPTVVPTATAWIDPTATSEPATMPTSVVVPTATSTPAPTATQTSLATSEAVNSDVDLDELERRVHDLTLMLAEELSPRQSATEEELRAAEFLMEEISELGYDTTLQDFEVTEAWGSGRLEILPEAEGGEPNVKFTRQDGETERIFFVPFNPLKSGIVEGEMVEAGLGYDEDFESIDVEGKIALVGRGEISFEDKETNAAENGAIGVVVYNNEPRFYFGGRLDQEPDIFAGGIPKEDGELLIDALEDRETINAELMVYPLGNGPSRNVIAEFNNDIHDDQVVLIGAHYDTTPWTQGANDNGSGVAAALILAEEFADDELPFDLRFVFFGSEETGLHGSTYYVEALSPVELGRIEAMINLDVVGTGDLSALGSESLIVYVSETAEDLGFDIKVIEGLDGATSDHAPFDEKGVPVVMVYADDLRYINHPDDTVEHLDAEPMGQAVAVVLGIINLLADSIEP